MRTCSTISSSVLGRPDQHSSAAAIAGDLAFLPLLNLHLLEELAAAEWILEMGSLLLLKAGLFLEYTGRNNRTKILLDESTGGRLDLVTRTKREFCFSAG